MGVYILANFRMNCSVFAFLVVASCTSVSILASEESLNSFVNFNYTTFSWLIIPASTVSPLVKVEG
ncbi:hypothetical protein ACEWAO_23645, partial [Vibrio parahaemolyticus]